MRNVGIPVWMAVAAAANWAAAAEPTSTPATQPADASPRGVYFTRTCRGDALLVLSLMPGKFQARAIPWMLGGMAYGESLLTGPDAVPATPTGTISLTCFNAAEVVPANCTYAVVDGQLWISVFVKERDGQFAGKWICVSHQANIFGPGAKWMPRWPILWDQKERTWQYGLYPGPEPVVLTGVRQLIRPGREGADNEPFQLAFDDTPAIDQFMKKALDPELEFFAGAPGEHRTSIIGLAVGKEWTVEKAAKAEGATVEQFLGKYNRIIERNLRGHYLRRGDVIIPPWGVCLGPAGLTPVKAERKELAGEWVDLKDPKQVFVVPTSPPTTAPDQARAFFPAGTYGEVFGRPDPAAFAAFLSVARFHPDEHGVSHYTYNWNCMMGHADYPAHLFWFYTGRHIVRYVSPGSHGPYNLPVQVFQRKPVATRPDSVMPAEP